MNLKRKTKKLSGLSISFYGIAVILFAILFFSYSTFYKVNTEDNSSVDQNLDSLSINPSELAEEDSLSITKADIYVPDIEVLPLIDSTKVEKEKPKEHVVKEDVLAKKTEKENPKSTIKKEESLAKDKKEDKEKITKIGTEGKLIAFIPGTMGKEGKLPSHNCKTKGELVMFITVDKDGNVTNAGRSSGIKDACNITAAVIWLKKYVKAKKSKNISQGTYTIKF